MATVPTGISNIGIDVKINSVALNNVTNVGEIFGEPNLLETTNMKATEQTFIPGVKTRNAWEVTCNYDNSTADSDFRKMKALETAGNAVPVVVTFPDKTTFTSSGRVSVRISAVGVNAVLSMIVSVALEADWTVGNPAST